MTVGASDRTPIKLAMLRALALSELNITRARKNIPYYGHVLIDLTAGDAAGQPGLPWWRASSPAIFSYLAGSFDRVRVRLYERDKDTGNRLVENLDKHLPTMNFALQRGGWSWINSCTRSTVDFIRGDSRWIEDFADVKRYMHAFISNDPNTMHDWACNMRHLSEMRGTAVLVSSMGCNSRALKRAVPLENRGGWFTNLEHAIEFVRSRERYDLRLLRFLSDINQWAYLVLAPTNRRLEHPPSMIGTSWRTCPQLFENEITHLFYNKHERQDGHRWQDHHVAGVAGAGGSASVSARNR